ncbi:unnamed protein product [Prorocentrum cordatum]|uniref:Uncharacterized protein n=1 Tax=Prorocentrum cordatum TaxID=2364126 RepID=A0ABN9XIQ6_9DINO|nr:unnamed protein product [Polarella glacialis]
MTFAPVLCAHSIVLGSILAWRIYQGDTTDTSSALVRILYEHVFGAFHDLELNVPTFTFDVTFITTLPQHISKALFGFDPTEFFVACSGLAALNMIISWIKPTMLLTNHVVEKLVGIAGFDTLSVAVLFEDEYFW